MASRVTEMLLEARADNPRLHRTIVRVGAACSWVITVIYAVVATVTGDSTIWVQAVSPLAASLLMTAQIALDKEDAGIALFGAGVVSTVWYVLFGSDQTVVAAAITTILISTLWMFFVRSHRFAVAAALTVALFIAPFFWPVPDAEKWTLAPIVAASFVLLHVILSILQNAAAEVDSRYQVLFDTSPSAVLEEDWSEAIEYVREEYTGRPSRLRAFLLAYPAVVSTAVGKARVLRANDAAFDLLEIDKTEDLVGYRNPNVVTEQTIEAFADALVRLYDGTPTWDAEIPMRSKDGSTRWLHARSMLSMLGASGSSIVVAITDITHLKQRHEAMADLVRAKDEFIATVSHELRTPLTAVIGLTTELADADMSPEEQKELMGLVAEQAQEMYNIVDDLLVAARADMGTVAIMPEEVDLLAELATAIEGVGIAIEAPREKVPPVVADSKRLRQILRNLLSNVDRYGGPQRRVLAGASGEAAWLEVRDNGPGIPDDEAERIFDPYVTGSSSVAGSVGLGLAVARQLAELMGGAVDYGRDGTETVFRLELPVADARRPALASQAESS